MVNDDIERGTEIFCCYLKEDQSELVEKRPPHGPREEAQRVHRFPPSSSMSRSQRKRRSPIPRARQRRAVLMSLSFACVGVLLCCRCLLSAGVYICFALRPPLGRRASRLGGVAPQVVSVSVRSPEHGSDEVWRFAFRPPKVGVAWSASGRAAIVLHPVWSPWDSRLALVCM